MDKHLILEFLETPASDDIDLSGIEYDHTKNLTVIKGTDVPAVNFDQQGTLTQTKTTEGTDSDSEYRSRFNNILMATATHTRVHNETPDEDPGRKLSPTMSTLTQTHNNNEPSDSDRDLGYSKFQHKIFIRK